MGTEGSTAVRLLSNLLSCPCEACVILEFRSVTHGTCAVNGRHISEDMASECRYLGKTPEERLINWRLKMQVPENAENQESGNGNTQGMDSQPVLVTSRLAQSLPSRVKRTYTPEQLEKLRANMAKARAARGRK